MIPYISAALNDFFLQTIYTRKLFDIVERHPPQVHCYTDDTQLCVASSPNQSAAADAAVKSMTDCISDVRRWMISDNLMLNDVENVSYTSNRCGQENSI